MRAIKKTATMMAVSFIADTMKMLNCTNLEDII